MSPLQQIRRKLYSREAMQAQAEAWKSAGERIVFTNGCFDLLHPGHIDYLAKAASLGTKFIIGLNTDYSVQRLKGPHRPIQSEEARGMLLGALSFTDAIVLFDEDTPRQLLSEIFPHIMVKGADYTVHQLAGADLVLAAGGSVVLLPYLKGYSTSGIERKIKEAATNNP